MAEERISSFIVPGALEELDHAESRLQKIVDGITAANAAAKKAEGFSMQASSIKEVAVTSQQLVDANGRLVRSYDEVSKSAQIYSQWKASSNGHTQEELAGTGKVIKLKADEAKAQILTNKAMLEAEKIRTQAARTQLELNKADAVRIQSMIAQEKELDRLIAKEEKAAAAISKTTSVTESAAIAAGRAHEVTPAGDVTAVTSGSVVTEAETAALAEQLAVQRDLTAAKVQSAAATAAENVEDDLLIASVKIYRGYVKELTVERDNLNLLTAQGAVKQRELNAEIDHYNTLIRQSVDAQAQQKINIGNYPTLSAELKDVKIQMEQLVVAGRQNSTEFAALSARAQQLTVSMAEVSAATKATAESSGTLAAGASKAFGALRTIANILPGIGIAGILGFAYEAAEKFVRGLFDIETASKKAEKAAEKYKQTLESIAASEYTSAQADIAHANVLAKIASNQEESDKNRLKAVKELQDTYPGRFGNLTKEAILEGKVADALRETTQELLNRAAAQAAEKKFAAAGEQVYELELALKKLGEEIDTLQKKSDDNKYNPIGFTKGSIQRVLKDRQKDYKLLAEQIAKAQTAQFDFLDDAKRFAQQAGDTILNNTKDPKPKKEPKPKDFTKQLANLDKEITEFSIKLRNPTKDEADEWIKEFQYAVDKSEFKIEIEAVMKVKNEQLVKDIAGAQADTNRTLLGIENSYQAGLYKSTKDYEAARLKAVEEGADKQAKLRIDALRNVQQYLPQFGEEYNNIQAQIDAAELDQQRKHNEKKLAEEKTYAERKKELQQQLASAEQEFGDQALSAISDAVQQRLQVYQTEVDGRIKMIDDKKSADIAAVNAQLLSEHDKAIQIAQIEAQALKNTQEQEKEKRKLIRQSAEYERAASLVRIAVDTFEKVAAIETTMAVLLSNPITAALGALAAAQIPVAIGAGALAATAVLAQKLPAYREGVESSPRGLAITDEEGAELYIERSGRAYLGSDAGPTLRYLNEGTRIIPAPRVMEMAKMMGLGLPDLRQQVNTGMDVGRLEQGLDRVEKAISANRSSSSLKIDNDGISYLVQNGSATIDYVLNALR